MPNPSGFSEEEAVPARPLGGLAIHRMATHGFLLGSLK
jgi:hypothetical protein